jgi:quinol monooxygenase YgiN
MSVHVTTQLKTRPEHTNTVIAATSQAIQHSLEHEGCEAIHLRQDQDDPANIVSFTQWATRQNYEDYLAWRTETGMTDESDELLTEPLIIAYFNDLVSLTR